VFDLLAISNSYKEAHWNLTGPLLLPLHEYYQEWADEYREHADTFAEGILQMGWSVDGRYATIARTTSIPDMPAGYLSDDDTWRLLITRLTLLQTEVYEDISKTEQSDAPTSNLLQQLAHDLDYNLWQLRVHLKRPGSLDQLLPWTPMLN
jgi:starvation-inducible DNA-binding protein